MATKEIEELKKSIAGFDKIINDPSTSPALKKAMETAKDRALSKLADLQKTAPAKDAAASEDAKDQKKRGPKPGPKKEPKKDEPKPKKKEEEEDEYVTVTVEENGKKVKKTFNINHCEEAIAAAHARKAREQKSNKKTKSKSAIKKAEDRIELATEGITDLIPEKIKEKEPKLVIAALEKFENAQAKAVIDFCKTVGVSQQLIEKLQKAYETAIDPIIEEIKDFIDKNKK